MSANEASELVQIPIEAPELEARIISVGAYLGAAAVGFFFMTFLFAFFYLRALNTNGLWAGGKPGHHVHPALTVGIIVLVCVVASVALVRVALVGVRSGRSQARGAGIAALALGLAAIAVQCWQYTDLGFGPSEGGYASVYLGWTGFFSIVAFGVLLWLEMLLASSRPGGQMRPGRLEVDLASFSVVWTVLGIVEVVAFILLYLVQ
jgi:heme/copper-type cytochrome/quinol oxidase subunit 3